MCFSKNSMFSGVVGFEGDWGDALSESVRRMSVVSVRKMCERLMVLKIIVNSSEWV